MKRTINNHNQTINLNLSSVGCAPCKNAVLNMQQKISKKNTNEIKIKKIKEIINSMFESSKSGN
tara:strand:- start:3994 stop:4185 length:192 start_codon:yes stop_codon:yes gene_type:complete